MNPQNWVEITKFHNLPYHESWKPFFDTITQDLTYCNNMQRLKRHIVRNPTFAVFPNPENLYNALLLTSLQNTKVVILGQDPYHNWANNKPNTIPQAMGLSFSVPQNTRIPPSLKNIFKELDINPQSGDLTKWAHQGVLLLNTSLTVHHNNPNGHAKYWKYTTDKLIQFISNNTTNTVFMLWGSFACLKKSLIDTDKHFVIETAHPSPLSANKGGWFGTKPFQRANDYLKEKEKSTIEWTL